MLHFVHLTRPNRRPHVSIKLCALGHVNDADVARLIQRTDLGRKHGVANETFRVQHVEQLEERDKIGFYRYRTGRFQETSGRSG